MTIFSTTAQMAGRDWFTHFMHRHKDLSIRAPQATSLARATTFNRHSVVEFFDKLAYLMDKHKVPPELIFNFDECGKINKNNNNFDNFPSIMIQTVQDPSKVVARKGTKQVGAMTSAERGTLVTMGLAVNAIGNSVPPIFVYPRKHFKAWFPLFSPLYFLSVPKLYTKILGIFSARWSTWLHRHRERHWIDARTRLPGLYAAFCQVPVDFTGNSTSQSSDSWSFNLFIRRIPFGSLLHAGLLDLPNSILIRGRRRPLL